MEASPLSVIQKTDVFSKSIILRPVAVGILEDSASLSLGSRIALTTSLVLKPSQAAQIDGWGVRLIL